ncbi:hypothetical protein AGMMS50284_5540 [Clostridia bacterium]|nr:hypothetical protein AGMMS50284_5540 [Clostridia bacterium]
MAGIIESYEYLRWTRRYSRCGSFEMKAIATDENLALLQIGNILWKNDDEEAGLIEFVELTGGEQEFIVVSGRFATSFLARRIVFGTAKLTGDFGNAMASLIINSVIAPGINDRRIPGLSYDIQTLGVTVNTQVTWRNVMETVTDLCEAADIGIKTVFNPQSGTFNFIFYHGADSQAIFSKEYENVIDQVFTQSVTDYANFAMVGGEGEGADRTTVMVGGGLGEDRYEIFVDAKDIQSADFPNDYTAALIFRGQQKLAEQAMVEAFDVTVNQHGNLTYKVDFDLGSKIQSVSKRWGVSLNARITEVEESYDRDGMSLSVTFGKPLLTLAQKLKISD